MPVLCPECKTPTLEAGRLAEDLTTDRCRQCGGHWVTYNRYFAYVHGKPALKGAAAGDIGVEQAGPTDSRVIKVCPACARFMRYFPVAADLSFGIDICHACGGIWLNEGEWPVLVARGLHRQLHAIGTELWQAELAAKRRTLAEHAALVKRLGEADVVELERIVKWINGHAQRMVVVAHLQQQLGVMRVT
jgi:Zn-finger nucleic acid-binding protein